MSLDPAQALELMKSAAETQIELNRKTINNHLDASDRIHARRASETLVNLAEQVTQNPTQPVN